MTRPGWFTWRSAIWVATGVVLLGVLAWLANWAIRNDAVVWLAQANQWIADTVVRRLGYAGVFLLMAVESSVLPLPAELVMPPAGDLARRLPDWNLGGVIAAGTLGSLAGALISYWAALAIGRPLVLLLVRRYGKFMHVSQASYETTERLFQRHGAISTFVGRLLPVVRHLISLPAGLSRMNLLLFSVLTLAGAGIWNAILAYIGYWFGQEPEHLAEGLKRYSHWVVAATVLLVAVYAGVTWLRGRRHRAAGRVSAES
jgi:membrane protein DedA with SNARE-associated domain